MAASTLSPNQKIGQWPINDSMREPFADVVPPRRLAYTRTLTDLLTVLESQLLLDEPETVERLQLVLPPDFRAYVAEQCQQLRRPADGQNTYAKLQRIEVAQQRIARAATAAAATAATLNQHNINSVRQMSSTSPAAAALPADVLRSHATYYDNLTETTVTTSTTTNRIGAGGGYGDQRGVFCPPAQRAHQQHHAYSGCRRAVHAMVAGEIGKKWRELGRELGVTEGRLDECDERHCGSQADKVHAMLAQFELRTLGAAHECEALQIGLRQVRRTDLAQQMARMVAEQAAMGL